MQAPPDAFIVTIAETPAVESMTVEWLILGSLGVAGSLALIAIVLGAVLSVLRILWKRWSPPETDYLPSVSPSVADRAARPSSPVQ